MPKYQFDQEFLQELTSILRSESIGEHYDSSGNSTATRAPFTGEWTLCALEFVPGTGRARVAARFCAGSQEVVATIDASDFRKLIGKRTRNPDFNSSRYSDLAVLVTVYIQEQILIFSPSELEAHEVRIGSFPSR